MCPPWCRVQYLCFSLRRLALGQHLNVDANKTKGARLRLFDVYVRDGPRRRDRQTEKLDGRRWRRGRRRIIKKEECATLEEYLDLVMHLVLLSPSGWRFIVGTAGTFERF